MKVFVIHIIDAARMDRQVVLNVDAPKDLGRAAHEAIDQVVGEEAAQIQYPIFIDIQSADQFRNVSWMYRN